MLKVALFLTELKLNYRHNRKSVICTELKKKYKNRAFK